MTVHVLHLGAHNAKAARAAAGVQLARFVLGMGSFAVHPRGVILKGNLK